MKLDDILNDDATKKVWAEWYLDAARAELADLKAAAQKTRDAAPTSLDAAFNFAFEKRNAAQKDSFRYWFWMVLQYALDRRLNIWRAVRLAGKIRRA